MLSYPDYKIQEIKLLDMDYQGDMVQMNNLIIICFGLLDSCTIFLYDINYSSLDSINIESKQTYKKQVRCSFCGKPQDSVRRIIAGPGVYICDECIEVCISIVSDENKTPDGPTRPAFLLLSAVSFDCL